MNEWSVIRENFHTKHSVLTAPDQHMPYIIQLHIMSIRWAYYEEMKQQNIWSVHMSIWLVSEKKTEAVNAFLINWQRHNTERKGGTGSILYIFDDVDQLDVTCSRLGKNETEKWKWKGGKKEREKKNGSDSKIWKWDESQECKP